MGAKTIKSLVLEEETVRRFHKVSSDIRQKSIRSAKLSAIYLPVVISISSIACAFAMVKGSNQVIAGFMTVGFLNAYVNYVISMFEPIHDIAASLSELQRMQASAERIIGLINTEADIVDDPEIIQTYGDFFNPKKENWPSIRGNVDFENVTFRYKGGEKVLNNFSLHVNAGENIAIVGPTGAGKSTLVNLLCRFYEPTEGNILIDGVDYRKRSQLWLQSNLGYVLQEPHLFSGTIKENIAYVKPDATMDEIVEAAKLVNAHSFIQKLDGGYNADVGEGGGKLSTGERQLISFARAVIHNPTLLVLDEATSSVDAKTEQAIQHAIEAVLKNRTSFVIAHRLSTIRYATRIIVIDRGQVVEMGTHDELMKKQDFYWRLYTKQLIDERSKSALGTKDKE
jgi:ATP-binding cassette subfamily B protein